MKCEYIRNSKGTIYCIHCHATAENEDPRPCKSPARRMPPLTDQIKSAAKAVVDFVADGSALLTDATPKQRLDICRQCEFFIRLTQRCQECGCFMPVKAFIPNEVCPLNPPKWGKANNDSATT